MNRKNILSCLAIACLSISCNQVYKEYDKKSFPTYVWERGQEILFTPVIEDISKSYNLELGIRHVYGFQLANIPVTVKSVSPSGKEVIKVYDFKIMDSEGKYIGSCGGDLCDLETVVDETIKFEEPGQYKYTITYNVEIERIPGVMEVGLIINTTE